MDRNDYDKKESVEYKNMQQGEPVKEEQKSNKQPKKKSIIWWLVVIVVILIAFLGVGYWYINEKMNKLNQTELGPDEIKTNDLPAEMETLLEEYTNIALFGVDNRSNGNYNSGNSDTIMIVSINNKTQAVKIVSVYRDTYLRINENGYYSKANAAYAYGGPAESISMLNTNFDLDITKYVAVDWYALVDAINLLGGVEIEITEEERQKINEYMSEVERVTGVQSTRVTDTGIVKLDGVQATAYVRIRKLAGNDYKRTQRQRIVIEAMFAQLKQSDLTTLNQMLDEIFPMIETNLKINDFLSMAMNITRYQIVSTTGFPFEKSNISLSGAGDCVIPITLEQNVVELHEYLFDEDDMSVSDEVYEISSQIINDTGMDLNSPIDTDSYTTGQAEGIEET